MSDEKNLFGVPPRNIMGYVQRRGPNRLLSLFWRRWFCVLNGHIIYFYKCESEFQKRAENVRLTFDLSLVYDMQPSTHTPFALRITSHTETVYLRMKDKESFVLWSNAIRRRMKPLKGADERPDIVLVGQMDGQCRSRALPLDRQFSRSAQQLKFDGGHLLQHYQSDIALGDQFDSLTMGRRSNRALKSRPISVSALMRSQSGNIQRVSRAYPRLPTNEALGRILSHLEVDAEDVDINVTVAETVESETSPVQTRSTKTSRDSTTAKRRSSMAIIKDILFPPKRDRVNQKRHSVSSKQLTSDDRLEVYVTKLIAEETVEQVAEKAVDEVAEEVVEKVHVVVEEVPAEAVDEVAEEVVEEVLEEVVEEGAEDVRLGQVEYGCIVQVNIAQETVNRIKSIVEETPELVIDDNSIKDDKIKELPVEEVVEEGAEDVGLGQAEYGCIVQVNIAQETVDRIKSINEETPELVTDDNSIKDDKIKELPILPVADTPRVVSLTEGPLSDVKDWNKRPSSIEQKLNDSFNAVNDIPPPLPKKQMRDWKEPRGSIYDVPMSRVLEFVGCERNPFDNENLEDSGTESQ